MIRKIIIFVLFGLGAVVAHGQEFTHTTTASNTVSSKSTIVASGLDNNPQAIIIATPIGETARLNPHPIGAWYYNGKWNIFNTDHAVMPIGMKFSVQVFPGVSAERFIHVITKDNLSEGVTFIDDPALNGNPTAQVRIFQNHGPPGSPGYNRNPNEPTAVYNAAAGKWAIGNINGKPLFPNTAYNVVVGGVKDPSIRPLSVPMRTREPIISEPVKPVPTRTGEPLASPSIQPQPLSKCTPAMAHETIGKWGRQRKDDLAMADRTFPSAQYKPVLAKAQEVIELFKLANPEFKGIEAHAYRGIRGQSIIPNGPLPFRVDVWYGSFICVGNDTYKVDMRGKIVLHGNYGFTTVSFNSLSDVLESVSLTTNNGDEIFQYNKDLGEFKGFPHIQTSHRDSYHEALIIAENDRLPFKPVTREQYIQARIKTYQAGGGMSDAIAGLNRVLENMSATERQAPALVRDVTTLPGGSRLFATEAEGGRHLVTIDKSYFNTKLPRDKIQLITVHWHSSPSDPGDRPKVEMLRAFKENFDFIALWEMLEQ